MSKLAEKTSIFSGEFRVDGNNILKNNLPFLTIDSDVPNKEKILEELNAYCQVSSNVELHNEKNPYVVMTLPLMQLGKFDHVFTAKLIREDGKSGLVQVYFSADHTNTVQVVLNCPTRQNDRVTKSFVAFTNWD